MYILKVLIILGLVAINIKKGIKPKSKTDMILTLVATISVAMIVIIL